MKVGVLIPSSAPERGGAYSFEWRIFDELLNQTHSDLEFVWIRKSAGMPLDPRIRPEACLDLEGQLGNRWINSLDIRLNRLRRTFNPDRMELTRRERNLTSLLRSRMDLLWSLTPTPLSTRLPFVCPVWDLQHRLQPFMPEFTEGLEWELRERYHWATYPKAAGLFVGTERGAQELKQFYGIDRSRICINPFPTPRLDADAVQASVEAVLKKYGLERGYIYYPAQFWPHKNHYNLLLALHYLHKQNYPLTLVLTGSDKGRLQKIKGLSDSLGLGDTVRILGFVPEPDVNALYQGALLLCFPSLFGPDNIPPLEAMANRCPAAVADVPGARDQLKDAAIYFDPTSPSSIAYAVSQIHDDSCLRQTLIAAGITLSDGLTVQNYVQTAVNYINGLAPLLNNQL